ncbi:MAG: hypothetical protein QXG86_03915 [Candidatus Woesearchaeota archaeon]
MVKDISAIEKEIIEIEVEKSRLNREKAMLVLNKSLFMYFCFLFVGIIGFINLYISKNLLNILIVGGLVVLIIGTIPYVQTMNKEEKKLNSIIESLRKKAGR